LRFDHAGHRGVVQEDALYVGSPIVAHLNRLREQPPLPLSALLRSARPDASAMFELHIFSVAIACGLY
jgi:hypothetical protein